ncbi:MULTISPECIES: zinc ribbon domain-containing protein [Marinobacter]|uniref:Zinc ribbon domain-containing protein n=1 Tax=Marinobacter xestospongiae TaxID=994319 RepID=A0ABU3VVR9_9GAMM|nr:MULTISPECIES: zinc ribbon domain-containing protein [Marinobacter]MCG8519380.1 zinc ribbon domain-containing protein [Pseudomonadales bacterium]MDV2078092.1 zinc ribbon domain-containing protein [Marinobacter xestospongiae]UDL05158.1 zinc ribbon domain-containing protein [Marinobacter sp. CA1]
MPVYDYKCRDHGLFHRLATLAEAAQPAPCPDCGGLAPRVIVMPSNLPRMAPDQRRAMDRNERARHEPLHSTAAQRQEDAGHRQQCGCGSPNSRPKLFYTADGKKMFPSMRPWMISH